MSITHFTSAIMIRLIVLALTLNIVVGSDELTFVTASCREDVALHCTFHENCQNYTSVTWYKFYNNSSDRSTTMTILIKSENVIQTDKRNDSVSLDKNASLVLRKVAPANSGIYKCLIRAKAGGMNCQNRVRLNISDCVSTASPIIFDFSTKFINESWANISIPLPHVNDDSVLFVLWGCVGLAVSKLVLSTICIWVFKELSKLKRRRT
ncbi:CD83 antigen-like [Sinocyclocheilus grahami]|uniref:CD83 antigen-like n=1 Tax=Sinocyclocheilus grahami TaxID=75366 RepID=UPI0007AD21C9|nr:PREDICTED: CD83 antigen-like [Sinocyclocheilus grahami]